jgi:hypothetical protein
MPQRPRTRRAQRKCRRRKLVGALVAEAARKACGWVHPCASAGALSLGAYLSGACCRKRLIGFFL